MTINTRQLSGVLLVVAATAGPSVAQSYPAPPGRYSGLPQAVGPAGEPDPGMRQAGGRPFAAGQSAVDRVGAPVRLASEEAADPYGTLTGQPAPQGLADNGLPKYPNPSAGSYPSPYYTNGPGCAGPLGRNGRIGYDLYSYTGATFAVGEGRLARELQVGSMTGGGARSLFFNTTHDAAWAADLGLSYQYNHGSVDHFTTLELRQAPTVVGTVRTPRPDILAPLAVRGLSRTNFNFGVGRDWWYWGPGSVGLENGWNYRFGATVGGRWGTAHIDEVPQDTATNGTYARRQGVTHGVYVESHATVEVPMGAWILFGGLRTEWGYDWMNLFPPQEGNLHNFNILATVGIRF
ncbi:MAG: hypothetical protein K8U57_22840 [Planctomycetes bacterium]|nr:hypothetical protein [Planctomycetota bacterium]